MSDRHDARNGQSRDGSEQIEYIYLCEDCGDEKATTSTVAGPFDAPPSVYCPCTGELREMEPKKVGEGDSLSVGIAEGSQ